MEAHLVKAYSVETSKDHSTATLKSNLTCLPVPNLLLDITPEKLILQLSFRINSRSWQAPLFLSKFLLANQTKEILKGNVVDIQDLYE
jgi:hypothetical protein